MQIRTKAGFCAARFICKNVNSKECKKAHHRLFSEGECLECLYFDGGEDV